MAHRFDGPDFGCGLALSADGGSTWSPASPVPTQPAGTDKCYAPSVAFDRQGTLHYLFAGLASPANVPQGVFLTSSSDAGRHFDPPRRVLGPYSFGAQLAIDHRIGGPGRMHVVWLAANREPGLGALPTPPNPIMAIHSDDGGHTWTEPVAVSGSDGARAVAPALALGPDGQVHVLYYDLVDDARDYQGLEGPVWDAHWALMLSSSEDAGKSFGRGVVVEPAVAPPERVMLIFTMPPPALAVPDRRTLFVGWHDARNGDWDVFLRRSDDGGRSWSPPLRLNDDALSNGRHQYQPRLGVAPDGRVDAVFYDRRDDDENLRNKVAYTFSVDGGRRFAPNRMLTSLRSDTRIGQRYSGHAAEGLVEFGSRVGLLSLNARAVAAWTDTSNSFRPVQQDVFTTVVRLTGTGGADSSTAGWAIGGIGIAVLLVAVPVALRARSRTTENRP